MSIATDIGRIATAKQEIKEVVNQDFNKITNETIDQYANKLQETYDEYESYIPWEHAKGSQIEFTKGGNGSYLEECIIEGNTEQNLYSGKNLCNYLTSLDRPSYNGITCTVADDIITFDGTATADNTTFSFIAPIEMKQSTTKVIAYYLSGSVTTYCTLRTFDSNFSKNTPLNLLSLSRSNNKMQATSQYDYTATSVSFRFNEGSKASNLRIKIMVTDDTNTDFEPYCGKAASPNPDYPQDIKTIKNEQNIIVNGTNMFNYFITQSSIGGLSSAINEDGSITTTGIPTYNYVKIANIDITNLLEDGARYTMSQETANNYLYLQINADRWAGPTAYLSTVSGAMSFTVNKSEYKKYSFMIQSNTTDTWGNESRTITNKYQLEKSSTNTTFDKYKKSDYSLKLKSKNLAYNFGNIWYSTTSNTFTANDNFKSCKAKVKPNTTYTISKKNISNRYVIFASEVDIAAGVALGRQILVEQNPNHTNYTFTTQNNENYIFFGYISSTNAEAIANAEEEIMIEEGAIATTYETYCDYELCKIDTCKDSIKKSTGKNLCGIPDQTFNHNGVDVIIKDGEITLNGTATSTGTKNLTPINTTILNGTYSNNIIYLGGTHNGSGNFNVRKASDSSIINGSQASYQDANGSVNITVNNTSVIFGIYIMKDMVFTNYKFRPQLVKGNSSDYNYEPYGKRWYIKKEIGSISYSGNDYSNFSVNSVASTFCQFLTPVIDNLIDPTTYQADDSKKLRSNYISHFGGVTATSKIRINIPHSILGTSSSSTTSEAKTAFVNKMANKTLIFYYGIKYPEYILIDNSTLINQLETIKELKTYENKTSIMVIGADANPVLDWTLSSGPAFQKWLNNPTINEEEEI